MREHSLERIICEKTNKRGGVAWKWVSPGRAGVPDRICIFPQGKVIFVELKRPGLKDGRSPGQKKVFQILDKLGCTVWRIDSPELFEEKLKEAGL